MRPLIVAAVTFACTFGFGLLGLFLNVRLPKQHLDAESRDVIKLVMGLLATLSALVLGLLIAAGHSSFEAQNADLQRLSTDVVEMDRFLALYGPETTDMRALLRDAVATVHDRIWRRSAVNAADLDPERVQMESAKFFADIERLQPQTDVQRFARSEVIRIGSDMSQTRLLMLNQFQSSLAWPFIVVLVFWLAALFLGFGLFARLHATVVIALLVGALSVSAAMLLIIDVDQPYNGFIKLSDLPLRNALSHLGQSAPP